MLESILESMALNPVRPNVYPGTYAIISYVSLMAEDVTNRSSASWKKAEHIFIDGLQPDGGLSFIPYWKRFITSDPSRDEHIQKLYVLVGKGLYNLYDANGVLIKTDTVDRLIRR